MKNHNRYLTALYTRPVGTYWLTAPMPTPIGASFPPNLGNMPSISHIVGFLYLLDYFDFFFFIFFIHAVLRISDRGRPKVEIPLSAITESRPKVMYRIRPKPYVPPKVKRDFRSKTETESQSCLSRHGYKSLQVPPSVGCPTITCIWYLSHLAPSCQPCGVSLMRPPDADADNAAASSV